MVEKGECILTHELHCTYIYTITYNSQLNVTHKLITHRFLITSLSSWLHTFRKKQTARCVYPKMRNRPIVGAKWGKKMIPRKMVVNTRNRVRYINCCAWKFKGEGGKQGSKGGKFEFSKNKDFFYFMREVLVS